MMRQRQTASQTAGPYLHIGCVPASAGIAGAPPDLGAAMIAGDVPGARIAIEGRILDGAGEIVTDAMVEIWQADAEGRFGAEGFTGWGRRAVDGETGLFRFDTIRPGALPGQAPHVMLWIAARGLNVGLHTRVYFDGDDHSGDPVLIAAGDRAGTMIATRDGDVWRHDIRLQGEGETVFLDV